MFKGNNLDKKRLSAYLFLLPAFLLFTIVIIVSAVLGFYYSFTNWDGFSSTYRYVGFANFKRLFGDSLFYIAIKNTLIITFFNVLIQNVVALIMAVLLDKRLFGRNFFRTLFFIPSLLSTAIVGFMFRYVLHPTVGSLPFILKKAGFKSFGNIDFLGNPNLALGTVIFVIIWQVFGYKMVIYLAGLQAIPPDIYESADIDGANSLRKFFSITLPLMVPAITINVFLTLVNTLRIFEHVFILTRGGPGTATETVATMVYKTAFMSGRFSYGTAVSSALYVATILVAIVQLRLMRKMEVRM